MQWAEFGRQQHGSRSPVFCMLAVYVCRGSVSIPVKGGNCPQPASYRCHSQWGHELGRFRNDSGMLKKKKIENPPLLIGVGTVLICGVARDTGLLGAGSVLCLLAGPTRVFDFVKMNDTVQLGFVHLCMSYCNLKVYWKLATKKNDTQGYQGYREVQPLRYGRWGQCQMSWFGYTGPGSDTSDFGVWPWS